MGMFDRIYDAAGNEWQTKAFGRTLSRWDIGDTVDRTAPVPAYQVEVFGGSFDGDGEDSWATIRLGRIEAVPAAREPRLPLLDYNGNWITEEADAGAAREDKA